MIAVDLLRLVPLFSYKLLQGTDAVRGGETVTGEVTSRKLLALDALGKLIRDEDVEELVTGEIGIGQDADTTLVVVPSLIGCRLLSGLSSSGIIENAWK